MSDTVICVENLSKKYLIQRQQRERYLTLRETIVKQGKALSRNFLFTHNKQKDFPNSAREEFWALKDISFEIKRGDRVGIIGRNGAGKSTLLKILSRITEPTTGRIAIKGRLASLLEVGTGFHPELTGRENIFLNGAILGMSKLEIKQKFDEIVQFAEIEKFIDTPVKRYSSGMYVRLAFAVAAHLEPEILVVDEVLAVGDISFQKKCLGKMEQVGQEGRTVLFVSHNMGAIKTLCETGIVLNSGNLVYSGDVHKAIFHYNDKSSSTSACYVAERESELPFITKAKVFQEGNNSNNFQIDLPIYIKCEFESRGVQGLALSLVIRNSQGDWIIHTSDEFAAGFCDSSNYKKRQCMIPGNLLSEGDYYIMLALASRSASTQYQKKEDILKFHVEFTGCMSDKTFGRDWKGFLAPGVVKWI